SATSRSEPPVRLTPRKRPGPRPAQLRPEPASGNELSVGTVRGRRRACGPPAGSESLRGYGGGGLPSHEKSNCASEHVSGPPAAVSRLGRFDRASGGTRRLRRTT